MANSDRERLRDARPGRMSHRGGWAGRRPSPAHKLQFRRCFPVALRKTTQSRGGQPVESDFYRCREGGV